MILKKKYSTFDMMNIIRKRNMGPIRSLSSNLTLYNTIMISHPAISQIIACEIQNFPDHVLDSKDEIYCLMTPPSPPGTPMSSVDFIEEDIQKDDIHCPKRRFATINMKT